MESLNSFAFNDIDGTRRTFIENMPNPFSNDELKELAKGWGGMLKLQATEVDQGKVDSYIQNKLGEKYDAIYPDDLERSMIEAEKEFQAFKAPKQIATPKSKKKVSENSVEGRRLALKDQTKGTRMAGEGFAALLDDAMEPWEQRERRRGDDIWFAKSAPSFERAAMGITTDIRNAEGNASRLGELRDQLIYEYGHGVKQADQEIADLTSGRHDKLATLRIGVPNAAADEGIANAIMRGSGIDVSINNQGDPITATDLMANIGSGPAKGVDAARQFRQNGLKINMFNNLPRGVAEYMEDEINRNPDKKLGIIIDMLNKSEYNDDKFMQSLLYNKAPGPKLQEMFDTVRKDYLISADMRGVPVSRQDRKIFGSKNTGNHGSYNPILGQDYRMVDLNMARDELLNTKIGELQLRGYDFRGSMGTNFGLVMPNDEIKRYSANALLDPVIMQEVKRRFARQQRR